MAQRTYMQATEVVLDPTPEVPYTKCESSTPKFCPMCGSTNLVPTDGPRSHGMIPGIVAC